MPQPLSLRSVSIGPEPRGLETRPGRLAGRVREDVRLGQPSESKRWPASQWLLPRVPGPSGPAAEVDPGLSDEEEREAWMVQATYGI